jgi:uncharacterized phiE125 gp8 family phage protein
MSSILLTPPAAEPLSLAEAKAWLRVDHDDDDALIAALVASARIHIEKETRRALIAQTWRIVRDAWPAGGRIEAYPAPLRQVLAARVYDSAGAAQAIDAEVFAIDGAAAPGVIAFAPYALPRPGRAIAGIEIDVEAGYGATASDVPEPFKQAIRQLVAHWYENRGAGPPDENALRMPASVAALVAPYRVLTL